MRASAWPCVRTRCPAPKHPCQDAPGTARLVTPKGNTGSPGRSTGTAQGDLTRGARGLPLLGWPAGHRDAAAGVPQMLLLRCRCTDARRQHHFAASASQGSVLSAAPPRLTGSARGAVSGGGGARASSPSCTSPSSRGVSPSNGARLRFPGEGSGLRD